MVEKARWKALGLGVLALGVIAALLWGRTGLMRRRVFAITATPVVAAASNWAGQSIRSRYPGLAEIDVLLADPATPDEQVVVLHLRAETPDGPDLLVLSRAAGEIRDGDWLRFTFEPLDDSAGKQFYFFVHSAGEAPIVLWANQSNLYPEGAWLADPAGDLAFQIGYRGRIGATWAVLLTQAPENKPGVFGQGWFYLLLFVMLLAALTGAAATILKRLRAEGRAGEE